MSEKVNALDSQEEKVVENVQAIQPAKPLKEDKKQEKPNKKDKVNKEKKPNKFAKKMKETGSELKKVTWPTFSKVAKQTGIVLSVVFIVAVVLFGIDRLLSFLFTLLTK